MQFACVFNSLSPYSGDDQLRFGHMDQKIMTPFMNCFTKGEVIPFPKPFQEYFLNTMNLRHFALLFLLLFTESTYRSCVFLSAKAFFCLPWDFGSEIPLLPHDRNNFWQVNSRVISVCAAKHSVQSFKPFSARVKKLVCLKKLEFLL